jgi:hypothetical protein
MPHVTFIHGGANKPRADHLLRLWRRTLAEASEPLPLGDLGVRSSLVYWADLMYAEPDTDLSGFETGIHGTPRAVAAPPPAPETADEHPLSAAARSRRITRSAEVPGAARKPQGQVDIAEGRGRAGGVPLPGFMKKRVLESLFGDVDYYLLDKEFGPEGKPRARIQQTIRKRFVDALSAPGISAPHVVVAHGMGAVIAYDCLKRVNGCPKVDGLITIGSLLGLDEIQDKMKPGWSRDDGFPHERVGDRWFNLFDRLDAVCGSDPELANDFQRSARPVVIDQPVSNHGVWRHSATKYLENPAFVQALSSLLKM